MCVCVWGLKNPNRLFSVQSFFFSRNSSVYLRTFREPMKGKSKAAGGARQQACAACKHQRKKCGESCVLAPYFPAHRAAEFQPVHWMFGVSNVTKMLQAVPAEHREQLIESLVWEAKCRQRDLVLGSYGELMRIQRLLIKPNCMPPPQYPPPRNPDPSVTALRQGRYSNSNGVQNNANEINSNAANFAGGGISIGSCPTYARTGSSVVGPSLYGSMVHSNRQSWQNNVRPPEREGATVQAVPLQQQPQQPMNGFDHQRPYYS